MGFRIFRILNKRLYLVYLWGGPLLFWKLGGENFSKTNNFFSVSLSVKTFFFSGVIFLQTNASIVCYIVQFIVYFCCSFDIKQVFNRTHVKKYTADSIIMIFLAVTFVHKF